MTGPHRELTAVGRPSFAAARGIAPTQEAIAAAREELAGIVARIAARGWCPATAGNHSVRLGEAPLRMLLTPSGTDKSRLKATDLLDITANDDRWYGPGKPSAEYLLHVAVYEELGAGSVLHVHTVWNTILSRELLPQGGITLCGYEILKGLSGVATHEHEEFIPILQNAQDMELLSEELRRVLRRYPSTHGFMLAGHGLYTWGESIPSAYRHLEALEFMFEVYAREGERRELRGEGEQ
jgi:methylthioribulose-1-phosphate dehydratase